MISRLTNLPEESKRPTVEPDVLVENATHDTAHLSDIEPMGYTGATFYREQGLLILTYQKHGNTYAVPNGDPAYDQVTEYADTGLGFLTVDEVVKLVAAAHDDGCQNKEIDPESYVLTWIESH